MFLSKRTTLVATSVVILTCAASTLSLAQPVITQAGVLSILYKTQILERPDRSLLKQLYDHVDELELSQKALDEIALALKNKVKRDRKNLKNLTFYLGKLVENGYARDIGNVRERDIDDIEEMIERLEKQTRDLYEFKVLENEKPNRAELIKIIWRDLKALIDVRGSVTTARIWERIKDTFEQPYQQWNAVFARLESQHRPDDAISEVYGPSSYKKRKFYDKLSSSRRLSGDTFGPGGRYTLEEMNFMRSFSRAQVIFRRISDPDSDRF